MVSSVIGRRAAVAVLALGTACGSQPGNLSPSTPTVLSVTLSGDSSGLVPGMTRQFSARANLADGSTVDVTTQASWISSNSGVASVSASGLVTALAAGAVEIHAAYRNLAGTLGLSVQPGFAVSGSVIANPTGQPVSGANLRLDGSAAVTTDAAGAFSLGLGNQTGALEVSASGFVTRGTSLAGGSVRAGIAIDLISLAAPFSLDLYRHIVRNGFESPSFLRSVNHWTAAPSLFIKTTDHLGDPVPQAEFDSLLMIVPRVIPLWSGGRFDAATIETGAVLPAPRLGWITIEFTSDVPGTFCGFSTIGANPGRIRLRPGSCRCGGMGIVNPHLVAHELGHAMGFYHTNSVLTMNPNPGCSANPDPTATERLLARVMYSRQNGNTDPDNDPTSFLLSQGTMPAMTALCGWDDR